MAKYILSVLAASHDFVFYNVDQHKEALNLSNISAEKRAEIEAKKESSINDLPTPLVTITIKGGSGVKPLSIYEQTRKGIVTEIRDESYELLKQHPLFQDHVKHGYMEVVDETYLNATKAEMGSKNLNQNDKSAPLTEDSPNFKDIGNKKAPKVYKNPE